MSDQDLYGAVLPDDPSLFDEEWAMEIIEEWLNDDGVAFTAAISHGDTAFIVENRGDGGCNLYAYADEESEALYKLFVELSAKAYPGRLEPEDLAVIWLEIRSLFP